MALSLAVGVLELGRMLRRTWLPRRPPPLPPPPLRRLSSDAAPPRPPPYVTLSATVAALPIDPLPRTGALVCLPRRDLQDDLPRWRHACALAHRALTGPLRYRRESYRAKVVSIVAGTMRLLMILGHFSAAKELDRAFFTSHKNGDEGYLRMLDQQDAEMAEQNVQSYLRPAYYELGEGLDLHRGTTQLAWMQSLALRLETGVYDDTNEFAQLLQALLDGGKAPINTVMVAFLLQQMSKLAGQRWDCQGGTFDVEEMLNILRQSTPGRDPLAIRVDLDELITSLGKQEGWIPAHSTPEQEIDRLRKGVQDLLVGIEQDDQEVQLAEAEEFVDALATDAARAVPPARVPSARKVRQIARELADRAHTLHLSVQYLILCARLSAQSNSPAAERATLISHSIHSSIVVYTSLLALLPTVNSSAPSLLLDLRQRQLSSFYRILWAGVGTFDILCAPEARDDQSSAQEQAAPTLDDRAVARVLDLIDHTLRMLGTLQPLPCITSLPRVRTSHISPEQLLDPRLLLISATFWRRFLFSLCLPYAPSRRVGAHARAPGKISWTTLRRTLALLAQCRRHDLEIGLPFFVAPTDGKVSIKNSLLRRALFIVLVRATLLARSPGVPKAEEDSISDRLTFLLDWFGETSLFERVDRWLVEHSVAVVLQQEWGEGESDGWQAALRTRASEWAAEGGEQKDA